MRALPVVGRELRVAARRPSLYWSRTAAALVALVVWGWVFLGLSGDGPPRVLGRTVFGVLAVVCSAFTLFLGVRYTADSLSWEKREGTLGLLFLTDLRGYDVVLGKLAACSVTAASGLMAVLPILGIPLLIGGAAPAEFGRLAVVIPNTLFFSLACGMFASAILRGARAAAGLTFLLILLVNATGPLWFLVDIIRGSGQPMISSSAEPLLVMSAGYACALVFDPLHQANPGNFWRSIGHLHLLAWLFLALASIAIRYSWRERSGNGRFSEMRAWWRRRIYGGPERIQASRAALLDVNPCLWLASRHRFKSVLLWAFLLVLASGYWAAALKWKRDWRESGLDFLFLMAVHTVVKLWMASEACQGLGSYRQTGALELLLSTPLNPREIAQGHLLALRRQFQGPVWFVLGMDVLLAVTGLPYTTEPEWWVMLWGAGILTFLVDLWALAWVGLWTGLVSRVANRAAGTVVAVVLLLPWILFLALVTTLAWLGVQPPQPEEVYLLVLFLGIGVGVDAIAYSGARWGLYERLRIVATHRFAGGRLPGPLSWIFQKDREGSSPYPAAPASREVP